MPRSQFTMRELLLGVTLVALGLGCLLFCTRIVREPGYPELAAIFAAFIASGPLIGAGIRALFQQKQRGAYLGLCFQFLLFVLATPITWIVFYR